MTINLDSLPKPTGYLKPIKIKSKKFSGTKGEALSFRDSHNQVFSNRHRDTPIENGDRYFIVKSDRLKKGNWAVWEVREGYN